MDITKMQNSNRLKKRWQKFHRDNPHVYERYKELVFQLIGKGYQVISPRDVFGFIRTDFSIRTKRAEDDFKINNNHVAYYARLFVEEYPMYQDHFRLKPLTA